MPPYTCGRSTRTEWKSIGVAQLSTVDSITILSAPPFNQTLKVTPAMEAGVSDHVWSLEEIANLVPEEKPKKRGPYKKKTN